MVYNFNKRAAIVLKGIEIGSKLTTYDLHQLLLTKANFTTTWTRAKFIKGMESSGFIKMLDVGLWEILKMPEVTLIEDRYL